MIVNWREKKYDKLISVLNIQFTLACVLLQLLIGIPADGECDVHKPMTGLRF